MVQRVLRGIAKREPRRDASKIKRLEGKNSGEKDGICENVHDLPAFYGYQLVVETRFVQLYLVVYIIIHRSICGSPTVPIFLSNTTSVQCLFPFL